MEYEQAIQREHIDCSALTASIPNRSYRHTTTSITKGTYVQVEEDLSPGGKSFGGYGWVTTATKRDRHELYEIEYIPGSSQKIEKDVPVNRLTVKTTPQQLAQLLALSGTNRRSAHIPEDTERQHKLNTQQRTKPPPKFECLSDELLHAARYNKARGRRKRELRLSVGKPTTNNSWVSHVIL